MSAGTFQQVGDAYKWTRDFLDEPLIPLPQIENPVADGLDAGLDSIVKAALDSTGLMDMLEEVTGNLAGLTAAAHEWQAQAKAMQTVSNTLRAGGATLAGQWEGEASNAFGRHMGQVVEAIDGTAKDMDQIAQIISQAAAACQLAENMIIEIIREAIEALIVSLAAMVAVDILTLGLATAADALVADAEITAFIARVERVSARLAKTLEKLMEEVREIKAAGKSFSTIKKGLQAAKAVRNIGAIGNRTKSIRDLVSSPSMENLGEFAAASGTKAVYGVAKGVIAGGVGAVVGADGPMSAVTDGLSKDPAVDAVTGQLDGRKDEAPYRVPKTRIEEDFG
ncbi:WXG100 family type VII secretion target [Streptomyces gibsoniae]|uniref:WXG100 family type VII secretion target n=1 Tax=Streptomyces gibsoniae TaxID=3075529 RepID=A0ABU2U9T8_9ACTN|nr:WXG100 family type VII secretion target [Streptomyces sp. DSM 41699]MDT0469840.1 WXG100 family type VII secretion target [Streptomyces sp. DSM 41699]